MSAGGDRGEKQQEKLKTSVKIATGRANLQRTASHVSKLADPKRSLKLQLSNQLLDMRGNLTRTLQYELEAGLAFNFIPVCLAIGIALAFNIQNAPSTWVLLVTCALLWLWSNKIQSRGKGYYTIAMLTVMGVGMLSVNLSTHRNATAIIERQITEPIKARVIKIDQNRRGSPRYILKPLEIGELGPHQVPNFIRLSAASKHETLVPGDVIEGLARMQPISGPVYPGGYDFSFYSWFQGLGGSGFFMGAPKKVSVEVEERPSWGVRFHISINRFRSSIERRLESQMLKPSSDVAIALVTGNKSHIAEGTQEALRKAGLAHILAISGLHMALVTLTIIWVIRLVAAFIPSFALHKPVKKYAICVGFIGATAYLFISGAGIATQRAWIMISVMLLAAMLDRKAITMRSVAISAIIILAVSPQSLLSPGFQMSFAAVAALVAGYEWLRKRKEKKQDHHLSFLTENPVYQMAQSVWRYFSGIAVTSLIAGGATTFFAAWHFHQVATLGLLANVLAMPIVAGVIMPFVLLSVLLMPYGLEALALYPVSLGIEYVIGVANFVDGLSPQGTIGLMSSKMLIAFGLFLSLFTLFKSRLRYLAFIPLILGLMSNKPHPVPDVLISEEGRTIAVKTSDEKLALLYPKAGKFVTDIWRKAFVNGRFVELELTKDQCNRERCIVLLANGDVLHIVYDPKFIKSSCQRADVLITPRLWWANCKGRKPQLILTRYAFERYGSHAIYVKKQEDVHIATSSKNNQNITSLENAHYRIETGLKASNRAWSRKVGEKTFKSKSPAAQTNIIHLKDTDTYHTKLNDIGEQVPQASPELSRDQK